MSRSDDVAAAAEKVVARGQALRALDLRKAGVSYERIADTLGYTSPAEVETATKTLLAELQLEDADDIRAIERERLDAMFTPLYQKVLKAGPDAPRAAEIALKIMDRRAALLGLDTSIDRGTLEATSTSWEPDSSTLADDFEALVQHEYDARTNTP